METHGSVSVDEASVALAAVERSRSRVAWSGYPAWYWVATGAGLGVLAYLTTLRGWWTLAIVAVGAFLIFVARAAGKARGVCEGLGSAMRPLEVLVLYGPAVALMLADAFVSKSVSWAPIPVAALVFAVFAGTGFALGARAGRR
jgi:hypothetical protein